MSTNINAKELNSRLWAEWKNIMNILEAAQKEIGK